MRNLVNIKTSHDSKSTTVRITSKGSRCHVHVFFYLYLFCLLAFSLINGHIMSYCSESVD